MQIDIATFGAVIQARTEQTHLRFVTQTGFDRLDDDGYSFRGKTHSLILGFQHLKPRRNLRRLPQHDARRAIFLVAHSDRSLHC